MRSLGQRSGIFVGLVVVAAMGCKSQGLSSKSSKNDHDATDTGSSHGESETESSNYLAAIAPLASTPLIPQCIQQRNAPSEQLAPSYFEQMQPCNATLPPQLRASSHAGGHGGSVDSAGDCNLGKAGATEVVCHYHTSYEFTSRDVAPADAHAIEVHCIAFKLAGSERQSKPIVFGTQLTCKAGTMPHTASVPAAGEHGGGHGGASSCGERLPELFAEVPTCDMRCCRDGTLTKANPGTAIRPTFAVCAAPHREVDCSAILANMHAHAPHRPHDRVGPAELYGQAETEQHTRTRNTRTTRPTKARTRALPAKTPSEGGVEDLPW